MDDAVNGTAQNGADAKEADGTHAQEADARKAGGTRLTAV